MTELKNPPRRSLVPRWNVSGVLAALIEKPFEPLRQATTRNLMLKVLFLLAATSARRVSEIHALYALIPLFLSRTHGLIVWHRTLHSCLRRPRRWPFPQTLRSPPFIQSYQRSAVRSPLNVIGPCLVYLSQMHRALARAKQISVCPLG